MKFNEKLVDMRKKKGISQEELGNLLDVTRQTISKWELGETSPDLEKIKEISKVFNVSIDDLINETENKEEIVEEKTEDNNLGDKVKPYNNYEEKNDYKNRIEDKKINDSDDKKNKTIIIIISIVLVILLISIIVRWIFISNVKKVSTDIIKDGVEAVQKENDSILDNFFDKYVNKFLDKFFDAKEKIDEQDRIEDEKWLEERNKEMDEIQEKYNNEYNERVEQINKEYNESVEQNNKESEEFEKKVNEAYEKNKAEFEKNSNLINEKIQNMK